MLSDSKIPEYTVFYNNYVPVLLETVVHHLVYPNSDFKATPINIFFNLFPIRKQGQLHLLSVEIISSVTLRTNFKN